MWSFSLTNSWLSKKATFLLTFYHAQEWQAEPGKGGLRIPARATSQYLAREVWVIVDKWYGVIGWCARICCQPIWGQLSWLCTSHTCSLSVYLCSVTGRSVDPAGLLGSSSWLLLVCPEMNPHNSGFCDPPNSTSTPSIFKTWTSSSKDPNTSGEICEDALCWTL